MSALLLEALTYLAVVAAAVGVALLIAGGIVLFDDWTDRMALRAVKRRYP